VVRGFPQMWRVINKRYKKNPRRNGKCGNIRRRIKVLQRTGKPLGHENKSKTTETKQQSQPEGIR